MHKLKFIVDECVGSLVAKWLTGHGYDVISVIAEMQGAKDITILNRAFAENRIIITSDKDFGDIVFHKKMPHVGIVLMRLQNGLPQNKIKLLEKLFADYADQLTDNFIVISEASIRIIRPILH